MIYHGTLHHGQLVTEPPIPDDQPVRVEVRLVEDNPFGVTIRSATKRFDPESEQGNRLREILSKLNTSLVDEIIAERRGDV